MKYTIDFIKEIENVNNLTDGSYLISLDVWPLYTNIPHTEGIKAVRKYFQKSRASISISISIIFLRLILILNNLVFNSVNYLQKKSCAIKLNAPLVMRTYFWVGLKKILSTLWFWDLWFLRYIDDIFLMWNGTKEEFEIFLQKISNCHPATKFEHQISKTKTNFLDTTVFKVGNHLRTKL